MASGQKRKTEDELSRDEATREQSQDEEDSTTSSAPLVASGEAAAAVANPTSRQGKSDDDKTDEQRRLEDRRAYNRANSARARLRSKQQIASLQATVDHQATRLKELEKINTELTEAVSRLRAEKEGLKQTLQLLVQGDMAGASSSLGGGIGGVRQGSSSLDSTSSLLLQRGGGQFASSFPLQQYGNVAGSSASFPPQQFGSTAGSYSMQLLASLGGGGGFRGGDDRAGQGLTSSLASAATIPASASYLGSSQGLGDPALRPYLGSLQPGTQIQSVDSQRAALLSALFDNSTTASTQRQNTGLNIHHQGMLHQLQTLGVPLNQTEAALELLLSRRQQQNQGGWSNDESENPNNPPMR